MKISVGLAEWRNVIHRQALADALAPAERAACRKHAAGRRRDQYLVSRWLVRQHLANALDRPPDTLTIAYPGNSPPHCPEAAVRLGLSHSHRVCLSVISTADAIGCDVECIRPRRHTVHHIARACFHPREAETLADQTGTVALTDFYRLWTLKEAAHKATGHGIGAGMDRPAFALRPKLRCIASPLGRDDWYFAASELRLGADRYALAVATACPHPALSIHHFAVDAGGRPARPRVAPWDIALPQ